MLTSASSEFIALCRSQVALLTQGLGADWSIVYLAEELVEGMPKAELIPVVAYPEAAVSNNAFGNAKSLAQFATFRNNANAFGNAKSLTLRLWLTQLKPVQASAEPTGQQSSISGESNLSLTDNCALVRGVDTSLLMDGSPETTVILEPHQLQQSEARTVENKLQELDHSLTLNRQIVLPLIHEGVVLGFLVTGREDRDWNERERSEIERIAQTLTLARLLDKRREWALAKLSQQQNLQAEQRDLLHNLLHQFRNSLMALRTFGKLLLKRFLPGDTNQGVAANLVRESDRLQDLLQQFDQVIGLTLDDFNPNKLPPVPLLMEATLQPVTKPMLLLPDAEAKADASCLVADVLEPLLASAFAIAQERHLDIISKIPVDLPSVRASARALREVLSNLIDNALKYTPAGGQISIQVRQQGMQCIEISDTGPGIPPQDLEHIFERHYRGVQADTEIPGTGLGLAIAKELVEQMQGEIEVKSPARSYVEGSGAGPGTTFTVRLPSSP